MRQHSRQSDALRPLNLVAGYVKGVPGSVLIEQGDTRVVCTATIEEKVPSFLKGESKGWITAEYAMLPGSSGHQRVSRERLKTNNRHSEIQRFIGRALRSAVDLHGIGERTITIDSDVIQADGSTRCASINGGFVALLLALKYLVYENLVFEFPKFQMMAAVSLGFRDNQILVDLDYEEDAAVDMDLNLVSLENKSIVEIQAFSEGRSVAWDLLNQGVHLGLKKNIEIIDHLRIPLNQAGIVKP